MFPTVLPHDDYSRCSHLFPTSMNGHEIVGRSPIFRHTGTKTKRIELHIMSYPLVN